MRVLICDDEPDIRLLFRTAFEREGAIVDEAADGDECLEVAIANPPDVVILDLMMPKRDGFSVLRELRADGRIAHLPVIVVTAIFGLSERMYATELGAADYVTKPFELDDLVSRVRALVAPRSPHAGAATGA